jgi:hypothetical protein
VRDQPHTVPDVDRGEVPEIPEIADNALPERDVVPEPEEPSVPAERPVGVDPHGTTAGEQWEGESLDDKLARERED